MKNLEEIRIAPIKCENKEGTEQLKGLHYAVNALVFNNLKTPISEARKERLLTAFIEIGKEVAGIQQPSKVIAKRDEILTKLRAICKTLKGYVSDEDEAQKSKVIGYTLSAYLRAKDNLSTEDIIKHLQAIKQTADDYGTTKALVRGQEELLAMLTERYSIEV